MPSGRLVPAAVVAGALGSLLFEALPPLWLLCSSAIIATALLPVRRAVGLAVMLLAGVWSLWNFHSRLSDRLAPELAGRAVSVSGIISSVPQTFDRMISFRFRVLHGRTDLKLPATLLVRWYEEWPELSSGERWRFELLLKPPWGPVNFQGPDREKWLFADGIGGLATVRSGELEAPAGRSTERLHGWRQNLFRKIGRAMPGNRSVGFVQALAIAERSNIGRDDRRLLALTGTSHLLAISGLHIGLAAAGGMVMGRMLGGLLPLLPAGFGLHWLGVAGGLMAAASYTALAGFAVPAVRSLIMLSTLLLAVSARRTVDPWRGWLLALALVLLVDPFAPLRAGFWFSFTAVAALLWVFGPRRRDSRSWWRTLVTAQCAVLLTLLPLNAWWYQGFSLIALAANLFAIPLVSFAVVPFVLGGVAVAGFSEPLAGALWSVAGAGTAVLLSVLDWMAALQGPMTALPEPGWVKALLAALGAFLLLLPRGLPGRWCALFLWLPVLLPSARENTADHLSVEFLDAGQGTAVLIRAAGRAVLYDTGGGDGAGLDQVETVIAPALRAAWPHGPNRILISHADLDHAGGLWSLRQRYPKALFMGNLRHNEAGLHPCHASLTWSWGSSQWDLLHPSASLPYVGNDSSCVLRVRQGGRTILLPGDISTAVENRLLAADLGTSDILLVPHHGSKTSSGTGFVRAVRPQIAVATAGPGNRFGFPRPEVVSRYRQVQSDFWSTGACGAIHIELTAAGDFVASSARRALPAIWRWPAAPGCPMPGAQIRFEASRRPDQSAP